MSESEKPIIAAIDDDPVILNLLVSMLSKSYNVRPFTSGKKALGIFADMMPDLILLDHQMPDMLGLDVLRAMKKIEKIRDIPVIFLTGSIDSENEVEALDQGAVDYISKPIRGRSLLTRVRLQLELQNHRKHLEELVTDRTKGIHTAYNKLKAREEITLNMLARATDMRDHGTGDHIESTTKFVQIIAEDLLRNPKQLYELAADDVEDIVRSAKLHDLGKIALPDDILLKPGKLTEEEFSRVKEHPLQGERFLDEFVREMDDSFLDSAREIAYAHHERWDGRGYPLGLAGADIPLSARIVSLADVYDALVSERPYKNAFTHGEAMKIILEGAGTQFDPYLITVFERHGEEFRQISEPPQAETAEELSGV